MTKEDRTREKLARAAGRRVAEKREPGGVRGPKTVYLDDKVYERFKARCAASNWSASEVLDDLMREFCVT